MLAAIVAVGAVEGGPARDWVQERITPWWRGQVVWLEEAATSLDRCGTECDGPVAVLGSGAPNLALTYLDRRGIVVGLDLENQLRLPSCPDRTCTMLPNSLVGITCYLPVVVG